MHATVVHDGDLISRGRPQMHLDLGVLAGDHRTVKERVGPGGQMGFTLVLRGSADQARLVRLQCEIADVLGIADRGQPDADVLCHSVSLMLACGVRGWVRKGVLTKVAGGFEGEL